MSSDTVDLFGGMNAASIESDPFDIPDDKHPCYVKECLIKETKSGKLGLNIVYKIADGKAAGNDVRDWFEVGPIKAEEGSEEYQKALRGRSFLKQRLVQLGIPETRMNSFSPDDLVGIEGLVQTKKREQGVNVIGFTLKSNGSGGSTIPSSGSSNPFDN